MDSRALTGVVHVIRCFEGAVEHGSNPGTVPGAGSGASAQRG